MRLYLHCQISLKEIKFCKADQSENNNQHFKPTCRGRSSNSENRHGGNQISNKLSPILYQIEMPIKYF